MASQSPVPVPQQEPQVLPPQPAMPQAPVQASIAQFNAIAAYVPAQAWTENALLDFHAKQKEIILDNNRIIESNQNRLGNQGWAGIVIVAGIVFYGLYLVGIGNAYGKELVGATILFLAGYMAGKGEARLSK